MSLIVIAVMSQEPKSSAHEHDVTPRPTQSHVVVAAIALAAIALAAAACSGSSTRPSSPTATYSGVVTATNGAEPLGNVMVSFGGLTTTTDSAGTFTLQFVNGAPTSDAL